MNKFKNGTVVKLKSDVPNIFATEKTEGIVVGTVGNIVTLDLDGCIQVCLERLLEEVKS